MGLTADQIKNLFRNEPDKTSHALALTLRDFGYPITDDWVKGEVERLLNNGEPKGGPSFFLKRWLEDGVDNG